MRFGVIASVLFHLAIVGVGLLAPSFINLPDVTPEPYIPLELIAEAELDLKTSVRAAAPKPVAEEQPQPDLPEPEVEETPAPVEEKRAPVEELPVEPEPAPVVQEPEPKAEPIKPEPKKADPPKPAPVKKPEPKNDELDLDALSQLIDKEREKEQPKTPSRTPSQTTDEADRARQAVGAGDRLTASDEAKMRAAIQRCWNTSSIIGAPEPENLVVVIEFELNRDGSLASQPRVANELQINLSGNQFWRVAQREAMSAVVKCAPYTFLPLERYDSWKEFRFNFDPSQMAGR